MTEQLTLFVDGRPVTGAAGQSVAGVLLSAGIAPGVFCGIGVCFGCLVTVDGVTDVRSCQRRAVDGMEVGL